MKINEIEKRGGNLPNQKNSQAEGYISKGFAK
jgi:hypothetical protein